MPLIIDLHTLDLTIGDYRTNNLKNHLFVIEELERYVDSTIEYYESVSGNYLCPVFFGRFVDAAKAACAVIRRKAGLDGRKLEPIPYLTINRIGELVEADDLHQ